MNASVSCTLCSVTAVSQEEVHARFTLPRPVISNYNEEAMTAGFRYIPYTGCHFSYINITYQIISKIYIWWVSNIKSVVERQMAYVNEKKGSRGQGLRSRRCRSLSTWGQQFNVTGSVETSEEASADRLEKSVRSVV